MNKNQAKILAAGLYETSKDKKGKELDNIISNFSNYLDQHHLVSMIPSILDELESIHFQQNGIIAAKVTSKDKLSETELKKIIDLVKERTRQTVELKTEIEQDLIGGVVVKYNDKIIDLSIKNQLNNLAKQLSN